jgi:membrane protein
MFCTKCGAVVDEKTGVCPNCGACERAEEKAEKPDFKKKLHLGKATKTAKSYAVIFSAFMVFPAMICTVVNILNPGDKFWAGYVLGAIAVAWVFLVLPVLRVTPAPVTAGICFVVLALYLLYIAKMQGLISWYYSYAVPICAVICAMVALTTGLISKKIAKGIHIPALLSAEAAVFLIFLEALYDFNQLGRLNLRWSLITMCVFVSISVICEAVAYVVRLNAKK